MTSNFQIQLNWQDPDSEVQRSPSLNVPIALGREFSQMPTTHNNHRVVRMVLNNKQVSRYHALIDIEHNHLVVIDQGSANGVFVNGKRQDKCILNNGDSLQIGAYKINLTFDPSLAPSYPSDDTAFPHQQLDSKVGMTDIFPIMSKQFNLHTHDFLIPGIVTVLFVVALLATRNSENFLYILAAYLAAASHYFIHKLCHKHKPWWLLVSVCLVTALPVISHFHTIINITDYIFPEALLKQKNNIFVIILKAFVGKGLFQELFKAVPILLIYFLARLLPASQQKKIGIWEPIDGILLGTAAATGFAFVETIMHAHEEIAHSGGQLSAGLTLLIPQILGDISGQVAYTGYFGYFIGLSALKPKKRWQLLGIGFLTSAGIHTFAATAIMLQEKEKLTVLASLCLAIIGSAAYAFLMAAILKARHLSPKQSRHSSMAH
ncbi:PrsW family glutamic-type intramembrane protease [Calothrix sp. 336/3]|uniref:PrsW family glutamic-type intramembrane protease n=1 Tax=Calothrix sp. 336/3 TaxID=1337936 RepID=UPI00069C5996|nr:PrsW family glutamic-type intramembrane protease [Calothrix sp. 336/3]